MKVLSIEYQVWKEELETFIPHVFDASFSYIQLCFQTSQSRSSKPAALTLCDMPLTHQTAALLCSQHPRLPGLQDLPAQT